MFDDVMIDLETLGVGPRAAIVQIGACAFDRITGDICAKTFKRTVAPDLSRYVADYSTVAWWAQQSQEARDSVFPSDVNLTTMSDALHAFHAYLLDLPRAEGDRIFWSLPSTFDVVLLENAYHTEPHHANHVPWKHWNVRCCRTLFDAAGLGKEDRVKPEIAHDALSDAVAQAKTVAKAFRKINGVL